MAEPRATFAGEDRVGGALCLDFTNTASQRVGGSLHERLHDFGDLVEWAEAVGLVDGVRAAALRAEAAWRPEDAAAVLRRAIDLRESMYRVFSAYACGLAVPAEDLDRLNGELEGSLSRRVLVETDGSFRWVWTDPADPLESLLGPLSHSAAELLTSEDLERVKECTNESCNWLFVDASRNRSRRWCDMKECGNRAKARRHYARKRGGREA